MSEYAVEVSHENFSTAVIDKSNELPVLVDFWAPWCAPCRALKPLLERLAEEFAGQFLLTTVNTDTNEPLAQAYDIRSIPAVKLFRHGAVVEEFVGNYPYQKIRELLEKHIERPSDRVVQSALQDLAEGKPESAVVALRQAQQDDPGNLRLYVPLATALMQNGELSAARETLLRLPVSRQQDEDIVRLLTRIGYLQLAADLPSMAELQQSAATLPLRNDTLYQLGVRQLVGEDYDAALETFLALVRQDRKFKDEAGRRALLDIFALLGPADPRVSRYRGLLSQALY